MRPKLIEIGCCNMADELDILAASVSAQYAQGNRGRARHMIQEEIDRATHELAERCQMYRERWMAAKDRRETGRKIK